MTETTQDKDWLKVSISRGLQALIVLRLDSAPSMDTVAHTVGIWYRVMKSWPITWDEELDRKRLTDAFLMLGSQCTRWPSPAQLRQVLPSRTPQKALPVPEYPKEKAQENLKKIKEMMKSAFKINAV